MDIKTFKESLDNIFPPSEPEALVKSGENPVDAFRAGVNARLRGVKKAYNPPNGQERMPSDKPGNAVMERENPISVGTMHDSLANWGPKGLGEVVSRLSPDMNKQDENGAPTSEYNQFVASIKQPGIEILLALGKQSGGVKVGPQGAPTIAPGEKPEDPNKKPGDELASL